MILRLTSLIVLVVALAGADRAGADSGTTPDFTEVRSLLLQHLAGTTEAELNQAAVNGLLGELKGRVTLLTDAAAPATNAAERVAGERRFDGDIGYLRVQQVESGLAAAAAAAIGRLQASNSLAGLVLDLRYAEGTNYAAAAKLVDLFLADEVPLLNAGQGLVSSKEKANAIKVPVVALINGKTLAAAEALVAMLRQTGVGLLIGSPTGGRAGVTTDYQLSTGQTLRVVTAPVQLGDAKALSTAGVAPDVEVMVNADDELAYFKNPLAQLKGGGDSKTALAEAERESKRLRVTEADLVREKRGDGDLQTLAVERAKSEDRAPRVTDPALARAIDLLKGLAVVRQWKF